MADKIAVMNHGVVEQIGTPQEIYDRPASHVRRRFHRLAADELPPLPTVGCRAATAPSGSTAPTIAVPEIREDRDRGRAGARRPARARLLSPMRRRCAAGLRRRISRHDADRHRRHRRKARSRRACRRDVAVRAGRDWSASRFQSETLVVFDDATGPRRAQRPVRGARPWLSRASPASASASARSRR